MLKMWRATAALNEGYLFDLAYREWDPCGALGVVCVVCAMSTMVGRPGAHVSGPDVVNQRWLPNHGD
jgi:hypothetical protein